MKRHTVICAIFVLFNHSVNADSIDFRTYQPAGIDRTADYLKAWESPLPIPQTLGNHKVLLVQGIMGNFVDFWGTFFRLFDQMDYFRDQKEWLTQMGVEYEQIEIDTEGSSENNSRRIEERILVSTKPVIILAHSKGGIDSLVALLNNKFLASKVSGVISIQSPYLGTPVADYLQGASPWNYLARFFLGLLGGSGETLKDLSVERRLAYYKKNANAIRQLQEQIQFLSFATWKNDEQGRIDTMFEVSRDLMAKKMGIESDGMIPWKSAVLPHSSFVAVEGIDHATAVVNNSYIHLDRHRMTHALFNLLLK